MCATTKTVAVLLFTMSAVAREASPSEWPLYRIIENLEQRVAKSSADFQAQYNLGRAHAFAFALQRSTLWVYQSSSGTYVADLDRQDMKRRAGDSNDPALQASPPTSDELLAHLGQGVKHLALACELAPKEARFHLTLAWLLEIGAHLADRLDTLALLSLATPELLPEEADRLRGQIKDLGASDDRADAARIELAKPGNLERALQLLSAEVASPNSRRQRAVVDLLHRYWIDRAVDEYWRTFE